MNNPDRVLALFDGRLSTEEAAEVGVTLPEADAALALAQLDLELERRLQVAAARLWLRHLGD